MKTIVGTVSRGWQEGEGDEGGKLVSSQSVSSSLLTYLRSPAKWAANAPWSETVVLTAIQDLGEGGGMLGKEMGEGGGGKLDFSGQSLCSLLHTDTARAVQPNGLPT